MALALTNDNFKEEVEEFDGVVLVDFWAEWCGPCQMIAPVIDELTKMYEQNDQVKIAKLNVDDHSEIAQKYGIMSIPALKIYKGGQVVDEIVGVQPKDVILEKLQGFIDNE